jgi:hypothetical protein
MSARFCAQLFGFVVLVTALFALPQMAQAHAGHAHTMHAHTMHVHTAHGHATEPAERAAVDYEVVEQSLHAATSNVPGQADDPPCSDRDCCTLGSCAACFSIVAPLPPLIAPPSLTSEISLLANPPPPGIAGAALRRPPRSFA